MKQKTPTTGTTTVQFRLPGRTNFNLSNARRFDTKAGVINIAACETLIPRERYRVDPKVLIKTLPALAPIFGSFLVRLYAFEVPHRLYVPELRLNDFTAQDPVTGARNFADAKYPQYLFSALNDVAGAEIEYIYFRDGVADNPTIYDVDSVALVKSNSLLEQIGCPQEFGSFRAQAEKAYLLSWLKDGGEPSSSVPDLGDVSVNGFTNANTRSINAVRILAYYDIFRNYFANPNERGYAAYVTGFGDEVVPGPGGVGIDPDAIQPFGAVGAKPQLQMFPIDALQRYFNSQMWIDGTYVESASPTRYLDTAVPLNLRSSLPFTYFKLTSCDDAGKCVKAYLPDYNSTFIGSAQYQKVIAESIVKVADGSLNLNDLLVGQRLYNYFQKLAATGARFDEYVRAEYGVDIRKYLDIPTFIKSWSFELTFEDVVSQNAFSADSSEGVGQLAGRGLGYLDKADAMDFSSDEPAELLLLMTIEPRVDYSKGLDHQLLVEQFDDLYTPSLDRMGMQPNFMSQVNSVSLYDKWVKEVSDSFVRKDTFTGEDPFTQVIGYTPAWQEYKTRVNRAMGSFANTLSYWTLLRDPSETIPVYSGVIDLWEPEYTSYIIPRLYNAAFPDVTEEGNPFFVQIGLDAIAKLPMSARSMTGFAEGSL